MSRYLSSLSAKDRRRLHAQVCQFRGKTLVELPEVLSVGFDPISALQPHDPAAVQTSGKRRERLFAKGPRPTTISDKHERPNVGGLDRLPSRRIDSEPEPPKFAGPNVCPEHGCELIPDAEFCERGEATGKLRKCCVVCEYDRNALMGADATGLGD